MAGALPAGSDGSGWLALATEAGSPLWTRSTSACIALRAPRISSERRKPVDPSEHRRLMEVFLAAAQTGDLAVLEDILTEDVVSYTDGNGLRGASRIPVVGLVPDLGGTKRLVGLGFGWAGLGAVNSRTASSARHSL